MDVHTNIPLKSLTTMRLGGPVQYFADVRTPAEVQALYLNAQERELSVFVIGGGSNLIGHDEGYAGLVMRMRIPGFEILEDSLYATTIKIGAGENWDETVKKTVDMRLTGIEAMSAIPGTVGGTPVQNVGAYGQDIGGVLQSLEAYDTYNNTFVTLQHDDCEFTYRGSMFRGSQAGRYIITSITITLSKSLPAAPFYESLQAYFDEHNIVSFTHQVVRDAVIAIRAEKLPDPVVKPSAGSFFKNSIIEEWHLAELRQTYPDIKSFEMGDGTYKVYSGWLIEKAGFKGQLLHGIRVNEKNCLVLINESATSYADLATARDEIIDKVRDMFRIQLEQEPLDISL